MVDQTSQFYAILTNIGAAKQANADALGIAWKITQMGVGDANNTDPTPNANQTSLINEWRRAPLNQLKVDDKDAAIIVAEQVIPAEVGGRWIREIGLYDADGDLVAVANCPPTYKPQLSQGSGRTQVVRMNLVVSSSSNVELKIDPSVVLATREWVTSELHKQDFKHSVLAATTANIALTGLQTIDGVALTAGARVLVKNQAAGKDNGLYTVAVGAWTRCPDADSSAEVTSGLLVVVERGTVNGDSAWQLVTDAPITLGVSALVFEMAFGRTGVAENTYRSVTVDKYGRVVAATNPTTAAGYGLTDVYTKTQSDQALALKAPLDSPALTGTPTAPTQAAGNNTTRLATTAFVQSAIAALVASSPAALDTLNELAAALGNDPNFAATVTNALALKAPLASPALTGSPTAPTAPAGANNTQLANTAFVAAALSAAGPLFTGTDAVTDWDSLVAPGWYSKIMAAANPNSPGTEVAYWYCLVLSYNGGSITQVAFPYGTNTTYGVIKTRSRYQGSWNGWTAPYTNNNVAGLIKNLLASTTSAAALSAIGAAPLESPKFIGTPIAPTADQFDATTKLATTEFVQRALGSFRFSVYNISASRALTLTDVGATLATNTPSNITLTLPNVSEVPGGGALHIYNQGQGVTTLVPAANGGSLRAGNVPVGAMELLPGDSVTLVRVPGDGVWYALHGSAANRYSGAMKAAVWDTAEQFDVSKKLATTEFVQRAIGGYQNVYTYTTPGQVIPASRANSAFNMNSGASSVTLPLLSSVPIGSRFYFRTSGTLTINRQGTDVIYVSTSKPTETSFTLGLNSNITFISFGGAWFIEGNGSLAHDTDLFGYLKGSNGYQVLPSGIIIQWCNGMIAANQGTARITLQKAFPNSLVGYSLNTANAGHWVTGQNATETGIDIIARTVSAGNIIVPTSVVGYTSMFIGY
nr:MULTISPECIES: phage tail protein [Pseudomonas]